MKSDVLDRLLITLAVRLHAFSICQIQHGWRLVFGPLKGITIHYVLDGRGSVQVGDSSWTPFEPGSIVVIPARLAHAIGEAEKPIGEARGEEHCAIRHEGLVTFTAGDGRRDVLLVCGMISASHEGALGLFASLQRPLVQNAASDPVLQQAFALMRAEIANPTVGTQALTEALMKQCLIHFLRRQLAEGAVSPVFAALRDSRLARAVTTVIEQPAAPHTVESLARVAGMSRASFAERFSETLAQTPIDFVQKVRLRLAAQLLTTTDLPVKVVAASIGYASRSYFSRAFRATYGVDPRLFREVGGQEEREPERVENAPPPGLFPP